MKREDEAQERGQVEKKDLGPFTVSGRREGRFCYPGPGL